MKEKKEKLYQIGEVSKICELSVRSLHYYDKIDLLKPKMIDKCTNYRYYTSDQFVQINVIKHFKDAGFSLLTIKELIEYNDISYNQKLLEVRYAEIQLEIERLKQLKSRVGDYIKEICCVQEKECEDNIAIKKIPSIQIVSIRKCAPGRVDYFPLRYTQLIQKVQTSKLHMIGPMMAIFHDNYKEYDINNADIEVCVEVITNEESTSATKEYGGFLAAISMHYGPYSDMVKTYQNMLAWITEHNYEFIGSGCEKYVIDCSTTKDASKYVTEIILPIKKLK